MLCTTFKPISTGTSETLLKQDRIHKISLHFSGVMAKKSSPWMSSTAFCHVLDLSLQNTNVNIIVSIFKILQIHADLRGPHLKESTINAVIMLQSFVSWARLPIISCSKTLQMMQTHDVDGKMWIFSAHAMNLVNKQAPLQ